MTIPALAYKAAPNDGPQTRWAIGQVLQQAFGPRPPASYTAILKPGFLTAARLLGVAARHPAASVALRLSLFETALRRVVIVRRREAAIA